MQLRDLSLTNYKNHAALKLQFEAQINCFIGNNGIGKTNVLDAIYHLCLGKSYFNPVSTQNVHFDTDFFILEGVFQKNDREEKINCAYKKGQKKILKRNGKVYERIAAHVGLIPLVIISPADRDLILAGSSVRRKFMDGVIGQSDSGFLSQLLDYQKVISQRNALLKYFVQNRTFNAATLEAYNQQLVQLGAPLLDKRQAFLDTFVPLVQNRYAQISQQEETIAIHYHNSLGDSNFLTALEAALPKDRSYQFTTLGPHKDDLEFQLNGKPLKTFGSQGQQKSFLIALKLAQFDYLREVHGIAPLVLLDDIFDKLDQHRVTEIVKLLQQGDFGQLFITDTHEDRTLQALNATDSDYEIFNLNTLL